MPKFSRFIINFTVGVALLPGASVFAALSAHNPLVKLEPFGYADVTLTGGPIADQARFSREFYLAIPNDNILNGFRLRAGLPAPGKPMGGWYDPDDFAGGCTFGQWISALSRDYANTGDVRFKDKVDQLVHGFRETIATDGFFFASIKISTNWPCYTYDKNCTGMRDAWTYAGNSEAPGILKIMTDWAFKNMPRRKDEWYTLPENLYNSYQLTSDPRYLEMAREYDYSQDYYNRFANGTNAFTPARHAYSHINSLCSAAKAYEVTGDEKYFRAISNAWVFLTGTQMYASGGWGPNERFVIAGQGELGRSVSFENTRWHFHTRDGGYANNFETPCGSYANIVLDRYLLRFTANPQYGDNLERVLVNGMLAALPMQSDGRTFYYSDYHPGAHKQYFPAAWPCCSGTYAEATADYPIDIYFHDDHGLYVNLFTPSQVRWQHDGQAIMLTQSGDVLTTDTTTFVIHSEKPSKFTLSIRIPEWVLKSANIAVNGRTINERLVPGTFFKLSRHWRDNDRVAVTFPKSLRFEPVDDQNPNVAALMYGPILLVALADGTVSLHGDPSRPEEWIHKQDGASVLFKSEGGRIFRPFYELREESYTTYCEVLF